MYDESDIVKSMLATMCEGPDSIVIFCFETGCWWILWEWEEFPSGI